MNLDLEGIKTVHFIGIGGIGMSALARLMQQLGKHVTGSDVVETDLIRDLRREGIKIFIGHRGRNVSIPTDLVVYSQAIPKQNEEWEQARKAQILLASYAEAMGVYTHMKYTIAIAGTHGKSTTTAMIGLILLNAGLDPTIVVGTKMRELNNSNFRFGRSNFLVLEACEYRRSFLEYSPSIVVLPNIDLDHLDYFKDERDYVSAFTSFIKKIPHGGHMIANGDDRHIQEIRKTTKGNVIDIHFGSTHYETLGQQYAYPRLQIPGDHNKKDAVLAAVTARVLDVPDQKIYDTLSSFAGTWRRFEYKGKIQSGALFYDDYGHHPTEIQATLQGARELYPHKRIICVFQPHQYSRTRHFLSSFASSFTMADEVIIPDIYAARDSLEEQQAITVDMFVHTIRQYHPVVRNGGGIENTALYLARNTDADSVVITMGAGNIDLLYNHLVLIS